MGTEFVFVFLNRCFIQKVEISAFQSSAVQQVSLETKDWLIIYLTPAQKNNYGRFVYKITLYDNFEHVKLN